MRCIVCAREQRNPVCKKCKKRTDLIVMKLPRNVTDPVMRFWGAGSLKELIRHLLLVELEKIELSSKLYNSEQT